MRLCPYDGGPVTPTPTLDGDDTETPDGREILSVDACHVCGRTWWITAD